MMSKILIKVLLITYLSAFFYNSYAVIPPAHTVIGGDGGLYHLKNIGTITYPRSNINMLVAAKWLSKKINKENNKQWNIKEKLDNAKNFGEISLYSLSADGKIPYQKTDKRYHESYIINIDKKISLYAGGEAGALYAVQRLFEMLKNRKLIHHSTIIDYPDYKWRGIYINLRNVACGELYWLSEKQKNSWLSCMQALIDNWSLLHINALFIQSPVFYRLNDTDIQYLNKLFIFARKYNIEPVPVLASKLWGIPLDFIRHNAIEGVYHKDAKFKVVDDTLIALDNVPENGAYKWGARSYMFNTNWYSDTDNKNNLIEQLSIDQPVDNNPWKNPVFIRNNAGEIQLKVEPGQYYELMLSIRSGGYQDSRIFITPIEIDKHGNVIKNLHRYSAKIYTRHNWQKRWISIFTSKKTHALSVQVSAKNISKKTVHIEIANPILIPMKDELINVLVNNETAPIIKSKDGSKQYIRNKDYVIRQTPIKEWRDTDLKNIKKTEINLLPGSNIHNGQLVSISFDTLPLEYRAIPVSKYSAASSYTYKEYQRIFKKLKLLSPKYIHISMDEHKGGLNRDSRSKKLGLCNRNLYISYINTLDDLLHNKGAVTLPQGNRISGVGLADTKLIMWDDMLNPWHNGGNTTYQIPFGGIAGTTGLQDNIDCGRNIKLHHDVLLADWWYKGNDKRGVIKNSPEFYRKLGYQYFISTWYQIKGIKNWLKKVSPSDTLGFIATTWSRQKQGIPIMACMAWNRTAYKKCLPRNH